MYIKQRQLEKFYKIKFPTNWIKKFVKLFALCNKVKISSDIDLNYESVMLYGGWNKCGWFFPILMSLNLCTRHIKAKVFSYQISET